MKKICVFIDKINYELSFNTVKHNHGERYLTLSETRMFLHYIN